MDMMLNASNVAFRWGEKEILKDLSLQLMHGRFTAVFGPCGAGKSTLLKYWLATLNPLQERSY